MHFNEGFQIRPLEKEIYGYQAAMESVRKRKNMEASRPQNKIRHGGSDSHHIIAGTAEDILSRPHY